jgi:hypothetical protein
MEESAALTFEAFAVRVGVAEVLARPAAGPDFGLGDVFCLERGDVAMEWNLGPMPLQYLLAVRVNLAVKNGGHAGSLEAQVEPPYAGEERRKPKRVRACGEAGLFR